MVHNASQKWLCSGNERIHFQIILKHVLWSANISRLLPCTCICTCVLALAVWNYLSTSTDYEQPGYRYCIRCFALHHASQKMHGPTYQRVVCCCLNKRAIYHCFHNGQYPHHLSTTVQGPSYSASHRIISPPSLHRQHYRAVWYQALVWIMHLTRHPLDMSCDVYTLKIVRQVMVLRSLDS